MSFYKYTPALLDSKTLEDTLIGRDIELDNLKRILKSASTGRSISHAILIGPKGIGKTHILRIINHAVKGDIQTKGLNKFRNKYIPVIFPEEEYLGNLTKLIILTLQYIADLKIEGIPPIPEELIKPVTLSDKQRELAISYLKTFKKSTGKSLLLLIDNLNDIIERFTEEDQSSLREMLMIFNSVLLIGAAPTLFDSIVNHDKPLYNFFEIIWLKELPFEETITLLNKYAELDGRSDLIEEFKKNEPKLRAIHELAGGNPRLILSMYHIILEGDINSVEAMFLKLLDELSPYFRERMKDLSAQQREIIDVVARAEQLLTPTEIAGRCYMPVTVVNAQLKRLDQMGYVFKSGKKRAKRVLYDLNEKLFRLWRQMRVEAGRKRLGFIVKFLEMWFTKGELLRYLDLTLKEIRKKIVNKEKQEISPYIDKIWYLKEAIPELRGDDEVCVACIRKDYQSALSMIEKSLKVNPLDVMMLNRLGCIYLKLNKFDETIEVQKKVLKIEKNNFLAWGNLGGAYKELKRYDDAVKAYKKVLKIEKNNFLAWGNLGEAYKELKRYDDAVKAYKEALKISPTHNGTWNNLGNLYHELKKYDKAIECYKKAIEIKKDYQGAWYNLGNLYDDIKRYDESIQTYKEAITINPNDHKTLSNLGSVYVRHNKYHDAIKVSKNALKLYSNDYIAWRNISRAYNGLKKFDEAIHAANKAIELKPDNICLWYTKGYAYFGLGNYINALESLNKAIEPGHCISCEHNAWSLLWTIYIILFVNEGNKGNMELSITYLKESLNCLPHYLETDKTEDAINLYVGAFKEIIKSKKLNILKAALKEIKKVNQYELFEVLSPYSKFIKYLESKDAVILERLHHEERIVVEEMIKIVEGEAEEKPKKKKTGTKKRKKKDSSRRSE